MGSRATKLKVLELFNSRDLAQILQGLETMAAKDVINALFALICREDPDLHWQAVTCMGLAVARLANQEMEEARIIMRRLLWSLNDESGGIGWGAPESMAEVMCCHGGLAEEYVHMLISYMREDGEEICQDGNYLEHPLLQRGLLWGVARLAACRPELLLRKGAAADIPPYLQADDGEVRGLAALACGRLGIEAAQPALKRLAADPAVFQLYSEGSFSEVSVGQLARQALEAIG
ncbi:DVU0298 family protein [Desulfobulbus propionicus]